MHTRSLAALLSAFTLFLVAPAALAKAPKVDLVQLGDGQYQLRVDGKPFFIKGAGGDGPKDLLAESGGNSFRTWGVGPDTPARLQRAEDNGLMVSLGFWLGHERHGFDYTDQAALDAQKQMVREGVLKYRDHPNVLMWVLGNEMEGFEQGDNPRIWKHIQELAEMVKELDPNRPTATVVAEIGGQRVQSLNRYCPDIDILGINSYAGGPSIPQRYREAGGNRPYMLTEYGPAGTWETGRTAFGAAPELTSTQKADIYAQVWRQAIEAERDKLCLGGYAFTWGFKQEATATWFGMFLSDGSKLGAVDAMAREWTGQWPDNRCPQVQPLSVSGGQSVQAGQRITINLEASDPDGDDMTVEWRVHAEADEYNTGGDHEDPTRHYPDAVVESDLSHAVIDVPASAGIYRVYALVRDGHNAAAMANIPIHATASAEQAAAQASAANDGKPADLPLWLYADGMRDQPFIPSGYMGGAAGITMTPDATDNPHTGDTVLKAEFNGTGGWAGVVWQDPANDWGDAKGGYDVSGAKALTFWARGQNGGEKVKFGLGLIGRDKPYFDTATAEIEPALTADWKQYNIPLTNRDLSRIKTGFYWVAGQPVTFYLDDIAIVDDAGDTVSPAEQARKNKPAMTPGKPIDDAVVYRDGQAAPWAPSGYMGNAGAIKMLPRDTNQPHAGEHTLYVQYNAADNWGGVVWQDPPNDWGDAAGGYDLSGKSKLTFWAKGEQGGEKFEFGLGTLGADARYPDSGSGKLNVTLTPQWKQYTIDLADEDLQRIKTGFYWVVAGQGKPVAFYLDDVVYE